LSDKILDSIHDHEEFYPMAASGIKKWFPLLLWRKENEMNFPDFGFAPEFFRTC